MKLIASRSQPWAAGKTLTYNPWVPAQSARGRRNVIRGFLLEATYQIDTDASGTLAGEDFARFFTQVQIEDVAGPRRLASGAALRAMGYAMLGRLRALESADLAASQSNSTGKAFLYVPFEAVYARGPLDCALPADLLRSVKITGPTQDTLDAVAGTSVDSVDYVVYADVREDDDPNEAVKFFSRDSVQETIMESATQGIIDLSGSLLAECFAFTPGADGGASMANWTQHQLIGLEDEAVSARARIAHYRLHRDAGNNQLSTQGGETMLDPFTANRAAIIHMPGRDYRMSDLPYVRRALKISAVNTVATPTVVHRTIEPESADVQTKVAQAYGKRTFYMATEGKTSRTIKDWGALAQFMPKKGR